MRVMSLSCIIIFIDEERVKKVLEYTQLFLLTINLIKKNLRQEDYSVVSSVNVQFIYYNVPRSTTVSTQCNQKDTAEGGGKSGKEETSKKSTILEAAEECIQRARKPESTGNINPFLLSYTYIYI